ncbi:chemotaxis protein CheB [Roseomonas sp. HF4]|uniref:chemotaxis protein CheB n=1 Tax=Roseomonas sp. HF4 TaxID=2562313 RepID=UPI0010C0AC7C|nr:chemotaxis protein CheB [Roseomonas sp. HF4]
MPRPPLGPASAEQRADDDGRLLIVAIGASAGGLDACRNLLHAMPGGSGMALILVQHLDPVHESMLVELLAPHTPLTVLQARDGMPIAPDHLYVIPPGAYLSVGQGVLHLSDPQARHGARLPFDFLLHSLAAEAGIQAACVVLSGTGTDGSLGIAAVRNAGGLVIAQDPEEAAFDGMPRSAIDTGAVDLVRLVADIPTALLEYQRRGAPTSGPILATPDGPARDHVPEIVALLREKTPHDFSLYKPGTLRRRIARRMAMAEFEIGAEDRYLELLRSNPAELELLSKDLLIHVTSFFRDQQVFEYLAEHVIPDLVERQPVDQPMRVWVPGCSTGEEAYSLAMLFREQIAATQRNVRIQIFASDADADAVASARDGLYPEAIAADVSPERLSRFFIKEGNSYRVTPELRAMIIFTVQDVLADAPFSRLDMVSCRNLLIYLSPEAQAKVIALFHFALRKDGILLLGNAETVGSVGGRFEPVSKAARVYRHVGRRRPGELDFLIRPGIGERAGPAPEKGHTAARSASYAELCRRMIMDAFAPAAVLIDHKQECLYSLGPTERFLRVPSGPPTQDLLAMAPRGVRTKLRAAIQKVNQDKARVVVSGGQVKHNGQTLHFSIDVQPARRDTEELLLVCFVEEPKATQKNDGAAAPKDQPNLAELQHDLDATRAELQGAIHNLEISNEELKAINEEALSASEEYQSANEELLTSKEELQSLNEELTALNTQLQETLERQRTTSNDLQNVLYSTDVATLFLDSALRIRFFTPATKDVVSVIPGDIGRPLRDLKLLAADPDLLTDARTVLQSHAALEREITGAKDSWLLRRILPYRTEGGGVEGVVITFVDITERKRAAEALEEAKRQAELANALKSRFLAAASHDLRQPLQTLSLLQGLLARTVESEDARKFVTRLGETLGAMSGMLNTLLDINQIEAGTIRPEIVRFPINAVFEQLRNEFTYLAEAQGLELRVVPCSLKIDSDPRLLEQILRNLLANALKFTTRGKVLLGCRRRGRNLRIEVWDTGIGIPDEATDTIFDEYHQLANPARERGRGLGLGLSIARRMAALLGGRIGVRSRVGKGSCFTIEVALPSAEADPPPVHAAPKAVDAAKDVSQGATILVVEDDPELCDALKFFLLQEGFRAETARDGVSALKLVTEGALRPDLLLADYNLPNGMDGPEVAVTLRERLRQRIPAVILTGDISPATLRDIALPNCVRLHKPAKLEDLARAIRSLLRAPEPSPTESSAPPGI